jgi:hypothetical protein
MSLFLFLPHHGQLLCAGVHPHPVGWGLATVPLAIAAFCVSSRRGVGGVWLSRSPGPQSNALAERMPLPGAVAVALDGCRWWAVALPYGSLPCRWGRSPWISPAGNGASAQTAGGDLRRHCRPLTSRKIHRCAQDLACRAVPSSLRTGGQNPAPHPDVTARDLQPQALHSAIAPNHRMHGPWPLAHSAFDYVRIHRLPIRPSQGRTSLCWITSAPVSFVRGAHAFWGAWQSARMIRALAVPFLSRFDVRC